MAYFFGILCILIDCIFITKEYKKRFLNASIIFVIMQVIMIFGVLLLIDKNKVEDCTLCFIYLLGNCLFISFYLLFVHNFNKNQLLKINLRRSSNKFNFYLIIILIISFILSILFFVRAGINIFSFFIDALKSGDNISATRKKINYMPGNGLIYQLRNFIIPIICLSLFFGNSKYKYFSFLLFPLSFLLLIGSGQRAGLVLVFLSLFIYVIYKSIFNHKNFSLKYSRRIVYFLVILLIIPFILLTLLNGRNEVSGSIFNAIIDRIFHDNQHCAILGFRYIYNSEIVYGNDWLNMFKSLIGQGDYTPVASLIHADLYGSLEGTSPPCLWGSAYYNFGYFGVFLISMFSAFISSFLYKLFVKKCHTDILLLCFCFLFVLLGTWIADSPTTLLNGGFIVVLCLLYFSILFDESNKTIFVYNNNESINLDNSK